MVTCSKCNKKLDYSEAINVIRSNADRKKILCKDCMNTPILIKQQEQDTKDTIKLHGNVYTGMRERIEYLIHRSKNGPNSNLLPPDPINHGNHPSYDRDCWVCEGPHAKFYDGFKRICDNCLFIILGDESSNVQKMYKSIKKTIKNREDAEIKRKTEEESKQKKLEEERIRKEREDVEKKYNMNFLFNELWDVRFKNLLNTSQDAHLIKTLKEFRQTHFNPNSKITDESIKEISKKLIEIYIKNETSYDLLKSTYRFFRFVDKTYNSNITNYFEEHIHKIENKKIDENDIHNIEYMFYNYWSMHFKYYFADSENNELIEKLRDYREKQIKSGKRVDKNTIKEISEELVEICFENEEDTELFRICCKYFYEIDHLYQSDMIQYIRELATDFNLKEFVRMLNYYKDTVGNFSYWNKYSKTESPHIKAQREHIEELRKIFGHSFLLEDKQTEDEKRIAEKVSKMLKQPIQKKKVNKDNTNQTYFNPKNITLPFHEEPSTDFEAEVKRKLTIKCKDGTMVQSKGEQMIAEFLYQYDIDYDYDKQITLEGNTTSDFGYRTRWARPDFYLSEKNVIIEYWGMKGDVDYDTKMDLKKRLYKESGRAFISIVPKDLPSLNEKLKVKLNRCGYNL